LCIYIYIYKKFASIETYYLTKFSQQSDIKKFLLNHFYDIYQTEITLQSEMTVIIKMSAESQLKVKNSLMSCLRAKLLKINK